MYNIERFIEAQEHDYNQALKEIRNGHKETHWVWYVFPQLKGLGSSENAIYFGISGLDEAREYMNHPILSQRLIEISEALFELNANDIEWVLPNPDDKKVHACMTLFSRVSDNPIFRQVIDRYYDGTDHEKTINLLNRV